MQFWSIYISLSNCWKFEENIITIWWSNNWFILNSVIFYMNWSHLWKNIQTRMHSSRMCTARLLPVSPSMHFLGGYLVPGGVYLVPGTCACLPTPLLTLEVMWSNHQCETFTNLFFSGKHQNIKVLGNSNYFELIVEYHLKHLGLQQRESTECKINYLL